ncbi:universal stress protein [Mycolicibacter longobardus]|uniref:Universal stress protein n=1 Tax=Mycolicibacter longobardus TaxID=1108812 RepID=A0A1X1YP64_9MYCO|nr:universal stress protein [Mycolicibacter longobardus]ORW12909.1 universal stress protein [Mycolicibacter longobardus]
MSQVRTTTGIVVAVDGSVEADAAVAWATHEAIMRNLPITLLHVVTPLETGWPTGPLTDGIPSWQADAAQEIITRARKVVDSSRGEGASPEVHTEIAYSKVIPTLIDVTKDCWMMVVGATGLGALGRLLLGSVSTSLLHHAHGPLAIIRAGRDAAPDAPVVVGIDGSRASETATALAFDEASRRGVPLVALHAWIDVGVMPLLNMDRSDYERQADEVLAERLAGYQEQYPDVTVERRVVADQPARWLVHAAEQAQLVVVGSRGRGGFASQLLGSVGSTVAQAAKTSVIVVRPRPASK